MEKNCKKFDYCNAPLCPFDEESLKCGLWYPDEEICRKKGIDWIKKQKKIARVGTSEDRYFTFGMLNKIQRIGRGIRGEDPNK